MNTRPRLALCLATLVAANCVTSATELLKFHFNNGGANIAESTPWTGASTFDAQLRAFGSGSVGLTNGPGLSQLGNADIWGGYAIQKASLAEAVAANHYITFTVQAAAGQALFLDGGAVRLVTRSGNVAANYPEFIALFSSVDGFTAAQVVSTAAWWQGSAVTLPVSGAEFDNLTGPVEFRLYIYRDDAGATSAAGYRLAYPTYNDFIALNGVISTELTLAAPTDLVAAPAGPGRIDLAWTDNTAGETAYVVERSPNGTAGWAVIATLPADTTTHADTGLAESTPYFYRVKATAPSGTSAWSSIASATTLGNPPAGATGLSATAVNGTKVQLDWLDNAANETGFKIERSTDGGGWTLIATVTANNVSYSDRTLLPDADYSYRVIVTNSVGDGTPSNVAGVTTPPTSTVNFLIFGNSYSHFYEYLDDIAASLGDTVNFVAMRNGSDVHTQLQAEQDEEDGLRTLPASSTLFTDGFSPLETNYSTYVRMKDILDQRAWDVISWQAHSSYANKFSSMIVRLDGVEAYFAQPQHEPSAEVVYYHTTQYQNDEHLFRNLVNTSAHTGMLRGTLPYTEDQHVFDSLVAAREVTAAYGYPSTGGGIVMENLRYDPRWNFDYPDPYFDYFYASDPATPAAPASRRLHYCFRWASDGTSNNPMFAWEIDSHPHVLLNFLTACLWYESLFRKDVRAATYAPAGVDAATAAIIRDVAHRTAKGELPPLRLADQASRAQYGDILWERASALLASTDIEEQDAGYQNLATLVAYFPEHAQAAAAAALLDGVGALDDTLALAARELRERPIREAVYQRIWDSSTAGNPVTIDLSLDGDPDEDGIPAIVELAFNLNPFANDTGRMPTAGITEAGGSQWLTLTHRRETLRTGFTIGLEASATLASGSWTPLRNDPDYVTTVIDPDLDGDGRVELVEQRVRLTPSATRLFLRISVTE